MSYPIRLASALALLLATACAPDNAAAQETQCEKDTGLVLEQTTAALAKHAEAHKRSDAAGAAAIYTDDVWILWEGNHEIRSRMEQQDYYAEMHKTLVIKDLVYTTDELIVCGDVAYEVGWYSVTEDTEGQLSERKDRWMVIWRHQPDGSWKIHRAVGHTDRVPEP